MPSPAPLYLRAAAAVYDLFPLIALWMLTAALFLLVAHGRIDVAHPPLGYRFALQLALFVVSAAYFVTSWTRGGQTIGMRAWRIRVVADAGARLSWARAMFRFVVALLSLLVFGIGFFWCLGERQRRGWQDLAAATRVVRLTTP